VILKDPTPRGPFKGPWGPFKGPRGPSKGPRGPFKGPRGPVKGSRGPFKGSRGPFKGPRPPTGCLDIYFVRQCSARPLLAMAGRWPTVVWQDGPGRPFGVRCSRCSVVSPPCCWSTSPTGIAKIFCEEGGALQRGHGLGDGRASRTSRSGARAALGPGDIH